jgi:hypothetical protein
MEEARPHTSAASKATNSGQKAAAVPKVWNGFFLCSLNSILFPAYNHVEKRFLRYSLPVERAAVRLRLKYHNRHSQALDLKRFQN